MDWQELGPSEKKNILNTWRHIGLFEDAFEDFIEETDGDYNNNNPDDDEYSCRSDDGMFPDTGLGGLFDD